ncbi:hypothetical protein ABTX34_11205 [Streptomyces sp. NPDC096538]|uniref:hypothetical protein n=1 Tax=Streptomyces sp. NPDC096538 TaxID=3155427 RepID=UPI003332F5CF
MIRRIADQVRALLPLLGQLGAGSRELLLRLISRFGWKAVLVGAAVVVFAVVRYRTAFGWLLAAWCAVAWMHAPRGHTAEQPAEAGEEPPPADPFPGMIRDLIGDAPGVHIKTVVAWLHETGLDTACTTADVTAGLTRRQIPIRASVRGADGRVNKGVHRDDLEEWLKARPSTPPAALSKGRSSAVATALTSGVADAATAVATPSTTTD